MAHRRSDEGGRARRRALCPRCTRSAAQVSLRVCRHACTHDSLTHHTAWTASPTIPSQVAAGQSSSHRVDIYDWPSRGPLELMVVHAAVQRFASFHRGCRPRAIAGSTSHSACYSTCCEWLFLRLSGASRAQCGWSLASDMDSASTVAGAVVAGRSAARLIRILRSR